MAQRLEDNGLIGPGKARFHRQKHVLTQAVGLPGLVQPQVGSISACKRLLLCTDGLSDLVHDNKIAACLQLEELEAAAGELVRHALDEGGKDNISLALIQSR